MTKRNSVLPIITVTKSSNYSHDQTSVLADRANEAIRFVVARWRAEPTTEASVKTHRGPTTTGRLTAEMSVRKPEVHPKPVRLLSNKNTTNKYAFVIFRAAASFTASLLSTEPSTPSSRTLQPQEPT